MRDILRKAKPQRLDDLIALNALYRPGPLRSGMVDDFIARKQGKTEVKYELPQLEPILARHLRRHRLPGTGDAHRATCSPASRSAKPTCCARRWARRTPRSWRSSAASSSRARRRTASTRRRPAHIFDLMEHFAGYGFNKSHSTAYAFLAYQTAYLKANYPWHFAAALLTIEAQNTDKLALYLGECRDRGIPVLPPDINESQLRVHGRRRQGVRFGLTAIKNVGEGAIESLLEVRENAGAHHVARTRCARTSICGWSTSACSRAWPRPARSIRSRRARGYAALPSPALRAAAAGRRRCRLRARRAARSAIASEGQAQLFGAFERRAGDAARRQPAARRAARGGAVDRDRAARLREGDARPLLERPSGRSLRRRAEGVRRHDDRRARRGASRRRARRRAGGRAAASRSSPTRASAASSPPCRQLKTRKGDRMAVFTLEDAQGGVEVDRRFPRPIARAPRFIETGTLVLVRGKLERDDETVRILASEIAPLDSVRERLAREVAIRLRMPADRGDARERSARSSRATAATGGCRSRSRPASRRTGCACGWMSARRSACGRRRR